MESKVKEFSKTHDDAFFFCNRVIKAVESFIFGGATEYFYNYGCYCEHTNIKE